MEGNLEEDPLLYEQGAEVGLLDYNSACRDAGTQLLPAGVELPETDLYGHPRVYGHNIDVGASEWIPLGHSGQQVTSNSEVLPDSADDMIIYPNPAYVSEQRNPQLKIICPSMDRSAKNIKLEVYNTFGQKLYSRQFIDVSFSKDSPARWDFRDNNGNLLSTGFYIVRLKADDGFISQKKLTVIK